MYKSATPLKPDKEILPGPKKNCGEKINNRTNKCSVRFTALQAVALSYGFCFEKT